MARQTTARQYMPSNADYTRPTSNKHQQKRPSKIQIGFMLIQSAGYSWLGQPLNVGRPNRQEHLLPGNLSDWQATLRRLRKPLLEEIWKSWTPPLEGTRKSRIGQKPHEGLHYPPFPFPLSPSLVLFGLDSLNKFGCRPAVWMALISVGGRYEAQADCGAGHQLT